MDKSRITASIWPWGTSTREQMETAAKDVHEIGYTSFESVKAAIYAYDMDLAAYKEVCDRYEIKPVSFYFHLPVMEELEDYFKNFDKELEFIAALDVKRVCLQATSGRPDVMDDAKKKLELETIMRFAKLSKQYGITTNLHPHHNSRVSVTSSYQREHNFPVVTIGSDLHHWGHEGHSATRTKFLPEDEAALVALLRSRDYLFEIGGAVMFPYLSVEK